MRIILFFLFSFYNFYLYSQSTDLKKEYKLTNKYFKEKKFNEALSSNEKALKLSLKEFGLTHLTTATLLENKGRLLLELNEYKDAEMQFREVLVIRNSLIDNYNPDIAEALNYLALSLRKQNKLKEAITEHNKVLNIMSNVIANNPGQILNSAEGRLYIEQEPIKLRDSCLLLKEITVKQKETLILQKKFLSAL